MVAVAIRGLDDKRIAILSQDHTVNWSRFADYSYIPEGTNGGTGEVSEEQQ